MKTESDFRFLFLQHLSKIALIATASFFIFRCGKSGAENKKDRV